MVKIKKRVLDSSSTVSHPLPKHVSLYTAAYCCGAMAGDNRITAAIRPWHFTVACLVCIEEAWGSHICTQVIVTHQVDDMLNPSCPRLHVRADEHVIIPGLEIADQVVGRLFLLSKSHHRSTVRKENSSSGRDTGCVCLSKCRRGVAPSAWLSEKR